MNFGKTKNMLVVACCVGDVMCSHGCGLGFVADSSFFRDWFVVAVVVVVIAVLGVIHCTCSRIWWSVLLLECSTWASTLLVIATISPFATTWHGQISFVVGTAVCFNDVQRIVFHDCGWMDVGRRSVCFHPSLFDWGSAGARKTSTS